MIQMVWKWLFNAGGCDPIGGPAELMVNQVSNHRPIRSRESHVGHSDGIFPDAGAFFDAAGHDKTSDFRTS